MPRKDTRHAFVCFCFVIKRARTVPVQLLLPGQCQIKADESFQHMMKKVGEEGVADAMIKGVSGLAEVYMKSRNAVRGENAAEISEKDLTPVAETQGLTSPVR